MMHADNDANTAQITEDPWLWTRQHFLRCSAEEKSEVDQRFWRALADNNLDGKTFLTRLDCSTLREYFNVTNLNQALSVLGKVEKIRTFSPRYLQWLQEQERPRYSQTSAISRLEIASHQSIENREDQSWTLLGGACEPIYSPWHEEECHQNEVTQTDIRAKDAEDAKEPPNVLEQEQSAQQDSFIPTPGLSLESYLVCDEELDYRPIDQTYAHRSSFSLERSYVQRRLRCAFSQGVRCQQRKDGRGQRTSWTVYEQSKHKKCLNMIVEDDLKPRLEWENDHAGTTPVETELQLTDWFDRIDWESRLSKYAAELDDEVLPPFGESDDEAIYDSDIMDEMSREEQDEIGIQERCTSSQTLSHFDVLSIIEQHQEQMQTQWSERYLPKLENCQAILYQEHHAESRRIQIERLQTLEAQDEDLQVRLTKLTESIAQQIYHSERAVRAQSEAMRESVYQLKENAFLLTLSKGDPPMTDELESENGTVLSEEFLPSVLDNAAMRPASSESSADQRRGSSCSDVTESEYVFENTTQPILEIDENQASVVTIESSRPNSENYFTSPDSVRDRTRTRYPLTPSHVTSVKGETIVLSSDSEEDETGLSALQVRKTIPVKEKKTITLALPTRKPVPEPPSRPRSQLLQHLKAKPVANQHKAPSMIDDDEDSDLEDVSDDEPRSQMVVFRTEDDENDMKDPVLDTSAQDVTADSSNHSEEDCAEPAVLQNDGLEATGMPTSDTVLREDKKQKKKGKGKRKRRTFNSESEDDAVSMKRRRPRRPINENAFERRKAQEKEREEIWARATTQLATTTVAGVSATTINIGEVNTENHIPISPKVAQHLKAHQIEGVRFLWRETVMMNSVNGCLLAHSMGLGKTLQIIAFLETLGQTILHDANALPRELRRPYAMILCPASLAKNWVEEFKKWVPDCSLGRIFDLTEDHDNWQRIETLRRWTKRGGIIIVSYTGFKQMIVNCSSHGPMFDEDEAEEVKSLLVSTARVVIADEAHSFKNERSKLGIAVRSVASKARIALTGSPLANNLMEYWSIIDWLDPNFFGSKSDFRNEHLLTIEAGNQHDASKSEIRQGQKQLKVLLGIIGGKIDRRNLDCLRTLLPNKFEYVLFLKFTSVQKRIYNSFLTLSAGIGQQGYHQWAASIVRTIRLRCICNHPALIRPEYTESKGENNIPKTLTKAIGELGPTALLSDEIEEKLSMDQLTREWRQSILDNPTFDLDGPDKSAKVKLMLEILKRAQQIGDKVLIFSFSIPTIEFLSECVQEHNLGPSKIITGASQASNRVADVKHFNELQGYAVCLISTKAGGQGLNITGANRVILFDHEFNPTWHEQAIGRAYRMGQEKNVNVYRFQIDGSFEIKMFQQALTKLGLTSRVVDKKNIQTKLKKHEALKNFFIPAPEVDRKPDKIEPLEDQLLTDVLTVCREDVLSVEKTESFHIDEENELDDADELDILAKKEAFWRELKRRAEEKKLVEGQVPAVTAASLA